MMRFAMVCVLALAAPLAFAGGISERKPLDIAAVVTQQEQIRDDVIAQNGRYKDMPATTRVELLSKQASLMRLLEGKKTANDLTVDEQVQAFNTLEWIEAAINQEEDERMICRREKALGTTRTTRICRTAAQEREARERARQELDRRSIQMSR